MSRVRPREGIYVFPIGRATAGLISCPSLLAQKS